MHPIARVLVALALFALAALVLTTKVWVAASGPFLEALPPYPLCAEAEWALADGRVGDALELAEAGGCTSVTDRAEEAWTALSATFQRCLTGVWTGRGEGAAGVGCAVASDLVVFGDVRDLTRQGLAWGRGEPTDTFLIALSATGLVLTFAPQVGLGNDLVKVARRAGTLTRGLADEVVLLVRRRAWRPLMALFADAGRVTARVGPGRATRLLAYADDAEDLADLARFVEVAPTPTLALRWGGKRVLRLTDEGTALRAAVARGPDGLALVAARGSRALLSRQPLVVALAKGIYAHPDALFAALAGVLRWATWPLVALVTATFALGGALLWPRRPRPRGSRRAERRRVDPALR